MALSPRRFLTLHKWDTVQTADSTEWCPIPAFQHLFVCGTYQVSREDEGVGEESDLMNSPVSNINRLGRIYLFSANNAEKVELIQTIELEAVLDLKWCPVRFNGKIVLGAVTATGLLKLFELADSNTQLIPFLNIELNCPNTGEKRLLALSLDWSVASISNSCDDSKNEIAIVVSDSLGGVNVFSLSVSSLSLEKRWQEHGYEAWIAAFDYHRPNIIYSGGDDCKLFVWDRRAECRVQTGQSHDAGVTSLHSNAAHEHILASGSYDEYFRLWDIRKMKNPLHQIKLGGGVWRLKWNPRSFKTILAACMHDGAHVVSCQDALGNSGIPDIFASYDEHESIVYGADWSFLDEFCTDELFGKLAPEGDTAQLSLISTCSFYDHKLCLSLLIDGKKAL